MKRTGAQFAVVFNHKHPPFPGLPDLTKFGRLVVPGAPLELIRLK